jgi:hypothetical protein
MHILTIKVHIPSPPWCSFNLSEIIGKKVFKPSAAASGFFSFSLFVRRDGDSSGKFVFHFYYVPCSLQFITWFCFKSIILLFLGPFHDFIRDFTMLNIECSCMWIITLSCVCVRAHTHTHTTCVCKIHLFRVLSFRFLFLQLPYLYYFLFLEYLQV